MGDVFFFNDTATTEIYTLSLHDALPICSANIITSDQFLEFGEDHLPDRIVFVGGGYISFEFAHIAARAGAKVTILHRGKQPLEHFDPDLVNLLIQRSRDIGIDIQLQSTVEKVDKASAADAGSYVVQ